MALHYIHGAALLLVILSACLYAMGRQDSVVRTCAKWVFVFALLFGVLPFVWGCTLSDSPTAPTSTRILGWTAAPGCSPTLPIQTRTGEPLVTVHVPGSTRLDATWVSLTDGSTLTVTFQLVSGSLWLVCHQTKTEKK